jgi:hypothetical protein
MRTASLGSWILILTTAAACGLASGWAANAAAGERRPEDRDSRARERAQSPRLDPGAVRQGGEIAPRSGGDGEDPAPPVPWPRDPNAAPPTSGPAAAVAEMIRPVLGDEQSGAERRRLSAPLRALIAEARGATGTAGLAAAPEGDGFVHVELWLAPTQIGAVTADLERAGARDLVSTGPRLTARLPFEQLPVLEEVTPARRIGLADGPRRPVRSAEVPGTRLMVGDVLSEGVPLVGAPTWQSFDAEARGLLRSQTVSIAILDIGFEGFEDLQAGELPPAAHLFTLETAQRWDIEGCLYSNPTDCVATGTALAEIVTDMNPRVDLHLISIDPDDPTSFALAVDYLVQQQVDLALGASIWSPGFYGDGWGTGPFNTEVERAIADGVTWINDIGDLDYLSFLLYGTEEPFPASGHWMGRFVDEVDQFAQGQFENDTYMDVWFEDQTAEPDNDTWLNEFCLGPGDFVFLDLIWDDWVDPDGNGVPAAGQDFRFDVWQFNDEGTIVPYDTSSAGGNPDDPNFQGGEEGDYPWDSFGVFNDGTDTECYYLSIFGERIRADSDNRFHLFWAADNDDTPGTLSAGFQPPGSIPAGTRMIPTDSPGVVGVGTTTLADAVESFNPNGILEEETPRVCAPGNVSTATFPLGGFLSSFSSAHVAGAVGLLMNNVGFLSAEDAVSVLESRARDITGSAPDTSCGDGRLCTLTTACPPP